MARGGSYVAEVMSRFQVFTMIMYWISRIGVSNVRTCIDVIFICNFYAVNFSVSSTKLMYMLSILDTLSMSVTQFMWKRFFENSFI